MQSTYLRLLVCYLYAVNLLAMASKTYPFRTIQLRVEIELNRCVRS